MSNAPSDELERGVARALTSLGLDLDVAAYDAWLDAPRLDRVLAGNEPVLVRVFAEVGTAIPPTLSSLEETFAPDPVEPFWLHLAAEPRLVRMRLDADAAPVTLSVVRVVAEVRSVPCCLARHCEHDRAFGEVRLELDGSLVGEVGATLVLAQVERRTRAEATTVVLAAARAAAARLGVELSGCAEAARSTSATSAASPSVRSGLLTARELCTWSLRREGEVLVLRDHGSHGPRDGAATAFVLGAVALAAGAAFFGLMGMSLAGATYLAAIGYGLAAVVLCVGAYTGWAVGRFAVAYQARSRALFWLAHDRLVFAPWTNRRGAVDLAPSGRYGAALGLGDMADVSLHPGGAIVAATVDHGPFEMGTPRSKRAAQRWCMAVSSLVEALRHVREDVAAGVDAPAAG